MRSSLDEVVELFEQAKSSVFKLMASVSVQPRCLLLVTDKRPGLGSQIYQKPKLCCGVSRTRFRALEQQSSFLARTRSGNSQSVQHRSSALNPVAWLSVTVPQS